MPVRLGPGAPCFGVLFYFAQNVIELTARDIPLHLFVPFVVFPTVEPRNKLGPLFKGEPLNCSVDLGQDHCPSLSRRRRFSNYRS